MFSRTQNPTHQQQQTQQQQQQQQQQPQTQTQQVDAPKPQLANPLPSMIRRFSRGSSQRKSQVSPQSPTSYAHNPNILSGPSGPISSSNSTTGGVGGGNSTPHRDQSLGGQYTGMPNGGVINDGRPISSATDASYDLANRPLSMGASGAGVGSTGGVSSHIPQHALSGGGLSRTDQIVLKHFWESKYQENARRDLHYLKFPPLGLHPSHRDLLPYCEIYHLVKTSPGANIISLGSADGVYIGFELQTGSQLHIDLDDDWFQPTPAHNTIGITHHRISFRPFNSILSDPASVQTFRTWPKPLTIEFLEDQYLSWTRDLMSPCWATTEVRELTGNGDSNQSARGAYDGAHGGTAAPGASGGSIRPSASGSVGRGGAGSVGRGAGGGGVVHDDHDDDVDDDYVSDKSDGGRI